MNEQAEGSQLRNNAERADIRFEATVHPGPLRREVQGIADLGLDRIPDPEGGVRVLVTVEDCVRLIENGYEVRLHAAMPVRPLRGDMVQTDGAVREWLEERMQGIERGGES